MTRRPSLPLALVGALWACSPEDGQGESGTPGSDTLGGSDEVGESEESTEGGESGEPEPDLPEEGPSDCERLEELLGLLGDEGGSAAGQAAIDEFLRAVSYGERGFPIVEQGKLAVVFVGAPGQAVAVAGDFNGWQGDEHGLDERAPGFYAAVIDLGGAPTGLYKLVIDGSYVADPLARRFGWDEFGEYSQLGALPERSHHERWPAFDMGAGQLEARTVTVFVPAGVDVEGDELLPVLYMHDGQNLFDPNALFGGWRVGETLDAAVAQALLEPILVVAVDNTPARFDEYTPVLDALDGAPVGGRADEYADFLADGVKPFVEARYPAASAPGQVGVMGSSLGGLVSLYIGHRHRARFGNAASMSGTLGWGSFELDNPTLLDAWLDEPPVGLRVYVDSGGGPGMGCPGDGSDNYCDNVAFADGLRALGWVDEDDLFYRWDPGAPHSEPAWADRLLPALYDWWP
ncbi:alpha/beta hydrolase [Plesiocystis pacifica]|uniref:alpha/beta hydrolase n=1 Tax=Plesiocystis pacifica TaxID=191768 RepID=UPI0002E39DFA|nr:alpha/beta hydrolase-fold protein [Plesiocystis pacifica]